CAISARIVSLSSVPLMILAVSRFLPRSAQNAQTSSVISPDKYNGILLTAEARRAPRPAPPHEVTPCTLCALGDLCGVTELERALDAFRALRASAAKPTPIGRSPPRASRG